MNLGLIMPESEIILKELWTHVNRTQRPDGSGSHWPNLEYFEHKIK